MSAEAPSDGERAFVAPDTAGRNGILLILAGAAGLGCAMVGVVVAAVGRLGELALHSMSTLPALISIGALAVGWSLLRTPRRVSLDPEGLWIETKRGARRLRWDEVGCATVEGGGSGYRRRLNLTDPNGKSIAKLDESFGGFDEMADLFARYVEAKGDDTAARILRKKARRQGLLALACGNLLALTTGGVAWDAYEKQRAERLLKEQGQPGTAEIVRRFVAPNGVTKRLEYRVVGAGGRSVVHNAEVEPGYWQHLEGAQTVPVVHVHDEPGISRLAEGEVERDEDPLRRPPAVYILAAFGGLVALLLLAVSPLMWHGWDLAHDSKTRRWSLKRYGKVVWSTRGTAGAGTAQELQDS